MKTQLKLEQRLGELQYDLKNYLEDRGKVYGKFRGDKISGEQMKIEELHAIDLQISSIKAKISILKEVLEIK